VPPKGFHRVRAFGLLHAEHRARLRQLQRLLAPRKTSQEPGKPSPTNPTTATTQHRCPHCKLRLLRRLSALECLEREQHCPATPPVARAPPPACNAAARTLP
jgi:hypothetical protein